MTLIDDPPWAGREWEDALEEHPRAAESIVLGNFQADRWIRGNATTTLLDERVMAFLHRTVFSGVFPDFAGRFRGPSPNYIAYNVTFGNRRGVPHDDVPAAMEALGRDATNLIQQLDELRSDMEADEFQVEVLKAAAYVHCRFVEIHPFVNGNGRTSRLCINYFLRRYGLPLMAIQRPDIPEYIDAIRTWIDQRSVDDFVQFLTSQIAPE